MPPEMLAAMLVGRGADVFAAGASLLPSLLYGCSLQHILPEECWPCHASRQQQATPQDTTPHPMAEALREFGAMHHPHIPELERRLFQASLEPCPEDRVTINEFREMLADARAGLVLQVPMACGLAPAATAGQAAAGALPAGICPPPGLGRPPGF